MGIDARIVHGPYRILTGCFVSSPALPFSCPAPNPWATQATWCDVMATCILCYQKLWMGRPCPRALGLSYRAWYEDGRLGVCGTVVILETREQLWLSLQSCLRFLFGLHMDTL